MVLLLLYNGNLMSLDNISKTDKGGLSFFRLTLGQFTKFARENSQFSVTSLADLYLEGKQHCGFTIRPFKIKRIGIFCQKATNPKTKTGLKETLSSFWVQKCTKSSQFRNGKYLKFILSDAYYFSYLFFARI
jgi:hypothetical protein